MPDAPANAIQILILYRHWVGVSSLKRLLVIAGFCRVLLAAKFKEISTKWYTACGFQAVLRNEA